MEQLAVGFSLFFNAATSKNKTAESNPRMTLARTPCSRLPKDQRVARITGGGGGRGGGGVDELAPMTENRDMSHPHMHSGSQWQPHPTSPPAR